MTPTRLELALAKLADADARLTIADARHRSTEAAYYTAMGEHEECLKDFFAAAQDVIKAEKEDDDAS